MKRLFASATFAAIASLGLGTGAANAVGANVIIILSTDARPFDVTVTVEDDAGMANEAPCAQPAYTVGGVSVWHGVDDCRNDVPTWIRVAQ